MKRSLRQDAERRGPEVDPVLYRFSSGVCWRLPIPSAINKKTVIPPPQNPPTPIVGTPSQASVAVGRESGHLHTHTPHPESAGSHRLLRVYAGRLSFLPFSTEKETHIKIHELHFFKELSNRKPFSLRFRNQFAPHGSIKLKTKRTLCTYRGAFYSLRQACRLISVMTAVQMSTKEKQQRDAVVPR